MLKELYEKLDIFRENITGLLDEKLIREKEKECMIEFPQAMVEFYLHFGNDKNVLNAYYQFDEISEVRIENGALSFGDNHQSSGRLGITLEKLHSRYQSISWYSYELKRWFSEGAVFPESFFFNIACWQVINTMPAIVRIDISWEKLEKLIGNYFKFFSDEKIMVKGYNVVAIYTDDILGCYIKDDEYLYLGTQKGDEVLEKCGEVLDLEMDWL